MGQFMLRDYQQRSIDMLNDWMTANNGNPCLVLPTGAGKSHIIAALCKLYVQSWPDTRILMLTHVKELIEQNSEKLRLHWPNAPMGIYSASLNKRQIDAITFAGIQSVRNKSHKLGHIDLCIIDECHLVSHKEEGGYRTLINELLVINPAMRVIGLSATPYRLGHGLITDKPALFDALIEPVTIEELIAKKHLAPLRSKLTRKKLSTDGVHKRGGDFIESELQKAVDTYDINNSVVDEVIRLAESRKAWLFFCSGVEHSEHVKDALLARGIVAECVTGKTSKADRKNILDDFKSGKIRALTNCEILTTGFDYPDIDLIAMLRPTMSPSLYMQMAGRGLRPKSHTDHCLVLDFAGAVETHGPITKVKPPKKGGNGDGEAPIKVCNECFELVHISAPVCPACGFKFPEPEVKPLVLHHHDIMGLQGLDLDVSDWEWKPYVGKTSNKEMIKLTYYGAISDAPITEYLCVLHDGFAGNKAMKLLLLIASKCGVFFSQNDTIETICKVMNAAKPPATIEYKKDGKYFRVLDRAWN